MFVSPPVYMLKPQPPSVAGLEVQEGIKVKGGHKIEALIK